MKELIRSLEDKIEQSYLRLGSLYAQGHLTQMAAEEVLLVGYKKELAAAIAALPLPASIDRLELALQTADTLLQKHEHTQ